jgi:hypothetical protein
MQLAKHLGVSLVLAIAVNWLGTYAVSPMHPVLAAPARGFAYLFGELLYARPSVSTRVTLDQVVAMARTANLVVWWFAIFFVLSVIRRQHARRSAV